MNKTVNINLAGIFFHIDEDAYAKLQRYLEAIKRSFTNSQGRSEIISDIEARIAELFTERMKTEKQVISIKEVEEVIAIMGQPEDYLVDEEIFEDEPKVKTSSSSRKLFRDTENAYVGGVSSGLGHYFDIDPLWIRLAWVILMFGFGTGFLIYILLWILMPAAQTTADKLAMSGKPVNITNIEQKVKEGFGNVKDSIEDAAEKIKNQDYSKAGNKIKSSSRSFFDALGNIIMFFFKVIAKFIGVILIIVGASTLIALFISLFSVGTSSFFSPWWMDYAHVANTTGMPIWLISLLVFFAVGVPFFVIFYLGLKILVNNLKSIGNIAKFTLLGLWLASILTLTVFGIREATEHAFDASVTQKEELYITSKDTLTIKMVGNKNYDDNIRRRHRSFQLVYNDNGEKLIYSSDLKFIVRSTKDSLASISIEKNSEGRNYQNAKEGAEKINYNYALVGRELQLDSYLTTDFKNKFRNQQVEIIINLPEGTVLFADDNTYSYHRNYRNSNDILDNGMEEHYLKVIEDDVLCLDCPEDENYKVNVDIHDDESSLKINEDGIIGEDQDVKVEIDSNGISIESKDN
ncbi:PspC domain-containing protein [Yeosuana sp. MJ-SS3]|uniref:PspC domain-containing protein n=1 Tax=Gilvirhabdus luticola TaxID=3079858 RepID=A0ABU3U7X5_9FLAO|nr:PspC domain-containing protein [Yeosuana sp. MJ-SS3]MDU8886523.1 PspC domain-containing protein [Yeosuana sp. MJ-SS3]